MHTKQACVSQGRCGGWNVLAPVRARAHGPPRPLGRRSAAVTDNKNEKGTTEAPSGPEAGQTTQWLTNLTRGRRAPAGGRLRVRLSFLQAVHRAGASHAPRPPGVQEPRSGGRQEMGHVRGARGAGGDDEVLQLFNCQ